VICLLPQCAYLSETTRTLKIHRALRQRGVPVRVATHGGTHEALLRAAGVDYDVVGSPMDTRRSTEFARAAVGLGHVGQSMYSDAELREYVAAEAQYFRTHGITVAVTGFLLTTVLSSRLAGVTVLTDHGSWVPPVYEHGLVPAPSQAPWPILRALPERAMRWLANAALPRTRFYCAGFNRVAAELGVEPVPSLAALVLGDLAMVTEVPDVLGITAAEMSSWRPAGRRAYRPGTRLRYTGPLYARLDVPLPEAVDEFLDRPGPIVYVAITSTSPHTIRAVVASLAALPVRALVSATVHDLADLANERVMVAGILPSHRVMPRVDLAITAGGQGSVQTAMAAGTPVLGIPLQPEQDLNVALLERQGAARLVPRRAAHTVRLASVADDMLRTEQYRAAADRVRRLYDAVDGPGNAADVIIETAATSTSVGSRG
jgi:UDP:flavonoid glycosyltransferase YjiC (YdhE family)